MIKLIISILICCALLIGCGDSKDNTIANDEASVVTEKEKSSIPSLTVKKLLDLYESASDYERYATYSAVKSAYPYLTYYDEDNEISVFAKKVMF